MKNPKAEIRSPKEFRSPRSEKSHTVARNFGLRISGLFRISDFGFRIFLILLAGCTQQPQNTPDRAAAAKALFERASRENQAPSAAQGAERQRLQQEAVTRYLEVVGKYPEQSNYCAQALRSVGNIYASQTNIDAAVRTYALVGDKYGSQQWELLQAWKSAGDLLSENGRREEARKFYSRIVEQFDQGDQPEIIRLTVRGSKARLAAP